MLKEVCISSISMNNYFIQKIQSPNFTTIIQTKKDKEISFKKITLDIIIDELINKFKLKTT